ncbi:MAG: hypothetical protein OXN25_16180 [Candidatus Poribacteria bacterium]|nr:hypothetical protein [Candidatus Poribacteria bacterium]MYK20515.1 hypothetical protein [Candidatus Poribacteria bacterium]
MSNSKDFTEGEWLTVAEAAEYGNMRKTTIYAALEKGLPHKVNDSGHKIINRNALEHHFCPFKQAVNYNRADADANEQIQSVIILQQQETIALLKNQIEYLQSELDRFHERESKLLALITEKHAE